MKNSYIYLTIIFIFTLIYQGQSAEDGDCILSNESGPIKWNEVYSLKEIEDTTKPNTALIDFKAENIENVNTCTENGKPCENYIDQSLSDRFRVVLKEHFSKYEDDEVSKELKIKVTFTCKNKKTKEIEFLQPIKDTNNHHPIFMKAPYNCTLPMPIPKDYNFQCLGDIIIRDVDLTNEAILVKIDNEIGHPEFLFTTEGVDKNDKKNYHAKLISKMIIDLEKNTTFTVFATDSGKPPRTTNTTISIDVDNANSLPRFSHPVYTANLKNIDYTEVKNIPLKFSENSITIIRGYNGLKNIEIKGTTEENKKHFKLTQSEVKSDKGIEVYVELIDLNEKFLSQKELIVVLTAKNYSSEANTILHISLPEVKNNTPQNKPGNGGHEECSTYGYMVATIMLSLISAGLLGYITYIHLRRNYW